MQFQHPVVSKINTLECQFSSRIDKSEWIKRNHFEMKCYMSDSAGYKPDHFFCCIIYLKHQRAITATSILKMTVISYNHDSEVF
jgi:hypothetical protein